MSAIIGRRVDATLFARLHWRDIQSIGPVAVKTTSSIFFNQTYAMAVSFATFSHFREINNKLTINEQSNIKRASASRTSSVRKNTFLSHSSKDAEFLPGVIKFLQDHGATIYCDLDDDRMPKNPDLNTATIIKKQIELSTRLVIFVTPNSKNSKWVPWELGIGDILLQPENVALLPTDETSGVKAWARQEYLGLYRHIVYGDLQKEPHKVWMVYDYIQNKATKLSDWCQ